MLPASAAFRNAEESPGNSPAAQVKLVFGDYFSSAVYSAVATASSSDGSGNYPPAGAIDGDVTELNIGPASGADNDVGLSSWRSSVIPSTTPQTLVVDMTQSRTISRIKLYHLSTNSLSSYKLESSPDNSSYTLIAKTVDQGGTITTTGKVDTIDFPNTTCRYVKLTTSQTSPVDQVANVVAIQAFRVVDVSADVLDVTVDRTRDYKLGDVLAATASVTLNNQFRQYSFGLVSPDALATANGFIGNVLVPSCGIEVSFGYNYGGTTELLKNFVGSVDRITASSSSRLVTLEARDYTKLLINSTDSCKLKTSEDIGAAIQYLLNRIDISSFESLIDTAQIVVDYFFTEAQDVLSSVRDLVQAAADAIFYFDENGIATFKAFLNVIPQSHIFTTEADWEAGTVLTNIETVYVPDQITRRWFLIDDFADGQYTSNPAWTIVSGSASVVSNRLRLNGTIQTSIATNPAFYAYGTYESQIILNGVTGFTMSFWQQTPPTGGINGYSLTYSSGSWQLDRNNALAANVTIGTFSLSLDASAHTIRISRETDGTFKVYVDGVLKLTVTDNTHTATVFMRLSGGGSDFDNLYYSPDVIPSVAATNAQAVYESSVVDMSASLVSFGQFQATTLTPSLLSATSVSFYTATSTDGVTFDAYVAATPGMNIASALKRYIKFKAILHCAIDDGNHNAIVDTPTIFDVTLNWNTGGGSPKYPATANYSVSFDSTLLELEQEFADNLGGDSSIINDAEVQGHPLLLSGSATDTKWQGTVGTPPVNISGSNPLSVTNGQILTYYPVVNGGMDIGSMSGGSPAAAAITFGGGASGTWKFTTIHPTRPVLQITITGTGTITDLRVVGKAFTDSNYVAQQVVTDQPSIRAFGVRKVTIDNKYIINSALAQSVANAIVTNFKNPTTHIYNFITQTRFQAQLGDRITVTDFASGILADYFVTGYTHNLKASKDKAEAITTFKLLKIYTGYGEGGYGLGEYGGGGFV